MLLRIAVLLLALLSSACASITAGTTQSVVVATAPEAGAECTLVNEKGTWTVPSTPGTTTITKAYGDLSVTCNKGNDWTGATSVSSSTGGAVFGNLLVGGIIGAAVDMSSGAAYTYPASITVPLVRKLTPDPSVPLQNGPTPEMPPPSTEVVRPKTTSEPEPRITTAPTKTTPPRTEAKPESPITAAPSADPDERIICNEHGVVLPRTRSECLVKGGTILPPVS